MRSAKTHRTPVLLANLSLEVQRLFRGEKQTVFTYVGDVDAHTIAAVLDHVERLCSTIVGEWFVEVESSTPGPLLLKALTHRFTDLHERGIREEFRVVPTEIEAIDPSMVGRWYRQFPEAPW